MKRALLIIGILLFVVGGCAEDDAPDSRLREADYDIKSFLDEREASAMSSSDHGKGAGVTETSEDIGQNKRKSGAGSSDADITGSIEEKTADFPKEAEDNTVRFVDVFKNEYTAEINPGVRRMSYDPGRFVHNGDRLSYDNGGDSSDYSRIKATLGIDVSHHNGDIDWEKVKADGYDFAFIRIAYRGYGNEGSLNVDKKFEENFEGATSAGLDVGVYIFSQAVNEKEAAEEADFVLDTLKNRPVCLPIMYDPESILDPQTGEPVTEARTYGVTAEQFTANTECFCKRIEKAGYRSGVYSNMLWEAFNLDLSRLTGASVWYADYELFPQTPYDFEFWQYKNNARVAGVEGDIDVNIRMAEISNELDMTGDLSEDDIHPLIGFAGTAQLSDMKSPKASEAFESFLSGNVGAKYEGSSVSIGRLITDYISDNMQMLEGSSEEDDWLRVDYQILDSDRPVMILYIGGIRALGCGQDVYHISFDGNDPVIDSHVGLSWCDWFALYKNGIMEFNHGQHTSCLNYFFDAREKLIDAYDEDELKSYIAEGTVKLAIVGDHGESVNLLSYDPELDMQDVQEEDAYLRAAEILRSLGLETEYADYYLKTDESQVADRFSLFFRCAF